MWVSHKVICIFYRLRCRASDLFSAEALTGCKLANIKHAITEQQAACQSPGNKNSTTATCRPSTAPPHSLTILLVCSKNSNMFHILSSNLKKNPLLRIFWQSDAFHKQQKYPSVCWPHLLFSTSLERDILQPFLAAGSSCLTSSSRLLPVCNL